MFKEFSYILLLLKPGSSIAREEAFERTKWYCNQRPRSRHRQTISMAAMDTIDWIAFQSPGFVEKGLSDIGSFTGDVK